LIPADTVSTFRGSVPLSREQLSIGERTEVPFYARSVDPRKRLRICHILPRLDGLDDGLDAVS